MIRKLHPTIPFVLMLALLSCAWFMRTHNLTTIPPGLESDTSHVLFDALRLTRGYPQPLDFDTRPEPFWRFLMAGWFLLVGPEIWTSRIPAAFVGLLTVAMTYRTTLRLLHGRSWRYLGAVAAAGAMAGIVPHLFLSRTHYRVVFTPFILLIAIYFLLKAAQTRRGKAWFFGGFFGALGMHTYIAGLMTPFLAVGFAIHQLILPPKGKRANWKQPLLMVAGMALPLAIWFILFTSVPDLYARVGAVGDEKIELSALSLLQIFDALRGAFQAIHAVGYNHLLYNLPHTPILNQTLVPFFYIGLAVAIWRLRSAEGAVLLGGLILFLLPAGLSQQQQHSVRVLGTFVIASLLVGWGVQTVLAALSWASSMRTGKHQRNPQKGAGTARFGLVYFIATALTVAIAGYAMFYAHSNYQQYFADLENYRGDPEDNWRRIPHSFTLAFYETLLEIEQLENPTYIPYEPFNTSMGGYMLQRYAYPNVVSWARYAEENNLDQLPAGDVLYPHFGMYHVEVTRESQMQLLLLPDEETMVVIPPYADGRTAVEYPPLGVGLGIFSDQAYWHGRHGWYLGRTVARPAMPAPDHELNPITEATYTAGEGLHLVGVIAPEDVEPAETVTVTLLWEVTAPQPATLYSVLLLLDINAGFTRVDGQVQHMHQYVFPSSYWQPGDIVPQQFTMTLSDGLSEGVYTWGIAVYAPPGSEFLPAQPAEVANAAIANMNFFQLARSPQVVTEQPLPDSATQVEAHFDDGLMLEGYEVQAGEGQTTITAYWRAEDKPVGDYTIFVHAEQGGALVAQRDERPLGGRLPTWAWRPGELVTTHYTLDVSEPDTLYIGMYDNALQRLDVEAGDLVSDNRVRLTQ